MVYRQQPIYDSNPNREQKREKPRSLLATVILVYIPTIIAVAFIRAAMLLGDFKIIDIPYFDEYSLRLGLRVTRFLQDLL